MNSNKITKNDLVIMIVSFIIFLLLVFTDKAKAMECKAEVITTSSGSEVCWVCTSDGKVVSIKCYR